MPTTKAATSYRLSDHARLLLEDLARWYGTTATGALEVAIRMAHSAGPPIGVQLAPEAVAEATRDAGDPGRGRPRKPPQRPARKPSGRKKG